MAARRVRRIGCAGAMVGVVGLLATALPGGWGAGMDSALAAPSCKRACVNGQRVCLRVGQRCSAREKADYLFAGFVCRKRGRKFSLARAGAATLRRGRYIALPRSGRPAFDQARQMFEASFDLPGVSARAGAVGRTSEGTGAIEALARYRSRLTTAQRAALNRIVRPRGANAQPAQAGLPPVVAEAKARLEARGLRFPHQVATSAPAADAKVNPTHNAWTVPEWIYGTGQRCVVYLPPRWNTLDAVHQRQTITHELMHCAMGELLSPGQYLSSVMWVREGLSEWAASTVAFEWSGAIGSTGTGWWSSYLNNGELELTTRSYDAVGFYALLAHEGVDVWSRIPAIVRASSSGNPLAAYLAATSGVPSGVFQNWGTTLAIRGSLGAPWDLNGAGMPRPPGLPAQYPLPNGGGFGAPVADRGGYAARLTISADVVRVTAPGSTRGRMRPAQGAELAVAGRKAFCAKPEGCKCKNGRDLGLPKISRGTAYIGYSGPGGSALRVIGESLAKACEEDEDPEGETGPTGPTGSGIEIFRVTEGGPRPTGMRIRPLQCTRSAARMVAKGSVADADGAAQPWRLTITISGYRGPGTYKGRDRQVEVSLVPPSGPRFWTGYGFGTGGGTLRAATASVTQLRVGRTTRMSVTLNAVLYDGELTPGAQTARQTVTLHGTAGCA